MLILSRAQALAYYKASSDAKMLGGMCDMKFSSHHYAISIRQFSMGDVIITFTSDGFVRSEEYVSLEDWAKAYDIYL